MKKLLKRVLLCMLSLLLISNFTIRNVQAHKNNNSLTQEYDTEKFIKLVERNEEFRVTDRGIEVQETIVFVTLIYV